MAARDRDIIDRIGKNVKDQRDTRVRLAYHTHRVDPCRGIIRYAGSAADADMYDDADWDQTTYEGDDVVFSSTGSRRMEIDLPAGLFNATFSMFLSAASTGAPFHSAYDSINFEVEHAEGAPPESSWAAWTPWNTADQVFTFVWSGTFRSQGADPVIFWFEGFDYSGGSNTHVNMNDGTVANIAIHYARVAD